MLNRFDRSWGGSSESFPPSLCLVYFFLKIQEYVPNFAEELTCTAESGPYNFDAVELKVAPSAAFHYEIFHFIIIRSGAQLVNTVFTSFGEHSKVEEQSRR